MTRNIIVGAQGDLGSQLADMSDQAGFTTVRVGHDFYTNKAEIALAPDDFVHLCIPAAALAEYTWLAGEPATVVLHDSVMNTSAIANHVHYSGQAIVAHMLMNASNAVVVEASSPKCREAVAHFTQLGLHPTVLSAPEHDQIMAVSQAPLALLCQVIHTPIKQYEEMGLLTTSGQELAHALDARSATWTPATMQSLLRNPQLQVLLDDMQAALDTVKNQ